MDYEQRYKEALERAKQFSEHPLQEDSANIVEYIFPELVEGEQSSITETESSEEYNETLAKRIEDCNLSVRTTSACKINEIYTLGDLCKLHKIDWLNSRYGGKKSLIELDELLHSHGLDWAE